MIKLEFLDFNLESEADCDYDYVVVHNGSNRFAGQLGRKACGTSSDGPHVSTSNHMFVCQYQMQDLQGSEQLPNE